VHSQPLPTPWSRWHIYLSLSADNCSPPLVTTSDVEGFNSEKGICRVFPTAGCASRMSGKARERMISSAANIPTTTADLLCTANVGVETDLLFSDEVVWEIFPTLFHSSWMESHQPQAPCVRGRVCRCRVCPHCQPTIRLDSKPCDMILGMGRCFQHVGSVSPCWMTVV